MTEVTNDELHRQIRAYEATVHNMQLRLDEAVAERDALRRDLEAVGAGGVQALSPKKPAQTQHQQAVAAINSVAQKPGETMVSWKLAPVDATEEMVRATDCVNFANADTDGTMHDVWHAMIAAAPQPAVAAGWVMVPIEPTDAMIRAGKDAESNDGETHLRPAWRYMLKAAPPAPIAAAAGWQPIETAPKDGRRILLHPAIEVADDWSKGHWNRDHECWIVGGSPSGVVHTAWHPLPPAPIAGESNE